MGSINETVSLQRPKVDTNNRNTNQENLDDGSFLNQNNDNNQTNFIITDDDELKYGAKHVVKIFLPVSICMLIVVFTVLSLPFYRKTNQYMVYTPFVDQNVETTTLIWQSFANAFILITVIAIMTVFLIILYKNRFYKIINGWLIISSLMLLFIITSIHVFEILKTLNVPSDCFTSYLFIWNFGILGMISIHWKAPIIIQQFYLLFISSLMALSFIKFIPEWTIWTVLGTISVWDLIAVLCPKGPLRILVETAQQRNEPLFPSLVYSSAMAYTYSMMASNQTEENSAVLMLNNPQNESNLTTNTGQNLSNISNAGLISSNPIINDNESIEENGVKLGLGDFVFYSVLVGKVSTYGDWDTTLACFIAILIGLCLTLLLLAIIKTALPALPISITFGLIFYFSTSLIVQPFTNELNFNQVFI